MGAPWGHFGYPGTTLGAPWGHFGSSLGPLWLIEQLQHSMSFLSLPPPPTSYPILPLFNFRGLLSDQENAHFPLLFEVSWTPVPFGRKYPSTCTMSSSWDPTGRLTSPGPPLRESLGSPRRRISWAWVAAGDPRMPAGAPGSCPQHPKPSPEHPDVAHPTSGCCRYL